jgi:hypothetical protein
MAFNKKILHTITVLFVFIFLVSGCATIELRSLIDPQIDMTQYQTFTLVNQAKPKEQNYLRDAVLLNHVSQIMTQQGYKEASSRTSQAHVTLVFTEGYKKVFVPPYTQPIISYIPGEFTTVTGKINGETVRLFGYTPPQRIERYVEGPSHKIDVYKLMLRVDIYDARSLKMVWTGTAYVESSLGNAIQDAKRMIEKLLRERLPII